jgi:sugar transferase (PEP-CTERM/EpsH1 system associated)
MSDLGADGMGSDRSMTGPLGVVHVVLSLELGGLERVVLDLVREGLALGQRVAVACVEQPGLLAPSVEAMGARLDCLGKGPGLRMETIGRMKALLDELRPEVVHTHQVGALFYAGPAARDAGVPAVVHTEHGKHYPNRLRARVLGRLASRRVGRFFCVSKDIADSIVRHRIAPRRKVHVVPNGIDVARFDRDGDRGELRRSLGLPAEAPIIGTVGRLDEVKRQDRLIRAFAQVRRGWPEARLLLVGDGPSRDELRTLTEGLGLGDCVHFAGYQPRPERYLHAMDVFALTSRSEGMPLAVLEAWAAGVPVVASRVGGLPELIDDGRTGRLIEPGDEAAWSEALAALLADPQAASRLGQEGRRHVRARFGVRAMATNYERHYRELLAHRGASIRCGS